MDLLLDLHEIIQTEYKKHGLNVRDKDLQALLLGLLNLKGNLILPKPMKVNISKELRTKDLSDKNKACINDIKRKIEQGININNYLGRDTEKISSKDSLLYDWGIHHAHLNNELDEEGRVIRIGYLLFFIIKENNAYFIDVTKHQLEDRTEFSQQQLLEITNLNWPNLLKPFRINDISLPNKYSDIDYKNIRNKGSMLPVEVDGDVYAMIGGGLSARKTNIKHMMEIDDIRLSLLEIESILNIQTQAIYSIAKSFVSNTKQPDFKLEYDKDKFYVVNILSNEKVIEIENLHEKVFFLDEVFSWKRKK